MRISRTGGLVLGMCLALGLGAARPADALSFYWAKVLVKTPYPKICISFARDSLKAAHLQNIRVSADEAAGSTKTSYVAITCVGTAKNATAVIMVASEDNAAAVSLRDDLRNRISKMQQID